MSDNIPEQIQSSVEMDHSYEQEAEENKLNSNGTDVSITGEDVPLQRNNEQEPFYSMLTVFEQMESQSRNYIIDKEHKVSYHHSGTYEALKELLAAFQEMTQVIREEKAETEDEGEVNDRSLITDLKRVEEQAMQMERDYRHLQEKITFYSFTDGVLDDDGVPLKPYSTAVKMSKNAIVNELRERQLNLERMLSFVENRHGRDDRMKAVRKLIINMEENESHLSNTNDSLGAEIMDAMRKIKHDTISNLPIPTFEDECCPEYFIATAARSPKWGKGCLGKGKGFDLLKENNKLGFKTVLDRFSVINQRLETASQNAMKIISDKVSFPAGSDEQTKHIISIIDAAHLAEMKNLKELYTGMLKKHQDVSFLLRRATAVKHKSVREKNRESRPAVSYEVKYLELVSNLNHIDNEIKEMEGNVMAGKKELKNLQVMARAAATDLREMAYMEEGDELKAKRKVLEREKERLLDLKRDVFDTLQRVKMLKNSDDPISPYNR